MLISQKILLIQLINFQKILCSFPSSATIYEGYKNTTVSETTRPLPRTEYAKSKLVSQDM